MSWLFDRLAGDALAIERRKVQEQDGGANVQGNIADDSEDNAAVALRRATFNAALECIMELVTRCPDNCREALHCRIIPILTSYISTHKNPPPNPTALRVLYQMVTCAQYRGEIFDGMMSCLTIPALTRLLDASLLHAGPLHCGAPLCLIRYIRSCQWLVETATEPQASYSGHALHVSCLHLAPSYILALLCGNSIQYKAARCSETCTHLSVSSAMQELGPQKSLEYWHPSFRTAKKPQSSSCHWEACTHCQGSSSSQKGSHYHCRSCWTSLKCSCPEATLPSNQKCGRCLCAAACSHPSCSRCASLA
jgi:hypothetical protein